jgi:spermidine/putrescine transport system permease protein
MSWKVMLGYNGVLNSGLMGLGIIDEPSTAFLYNSTAVVITLTHAWAAFAILPIFVSLEKVDRTLLEAATDLGDGPDPPLRPRHAAACRCRASSRPS